MGVRVGSFVEYMGVYDCRPTTESAVPAEIPADVCVSLEDAWRAVDSKKLWTSSNYLSRVERKLAAHFEQLGAGKVALAYALVEVIKSVGSSSSVGSALDLCEQLLGRDEDARSRPWRLDGRTRELPDLPWGSEALGSVDDQPSLIPTKLEIYNWVCGADTGLPDSP